MATVTMKRARELALAFIKADIIPMLLGPPGLGKTTTASGIADELNLVLRDIRLAQYQGTDIAGFPFVVDGKLRTADFDDELFPLEYTPLPEGKDGWLVFLDELPNAEYDCIKVILRVLQERRLGNKAIHEKVVFMAAGNPKEKGSMSYHMPDALVDRLAILNVDYEIKGWLEHAEATGISPELISAVRSTGSVSVSNWGPDKNSPDTPFISPRSLAALDRCLKAGVSDVDAFVAIAGPKVLRYHSVMSVQSAQKPDWWDDFVASPIGRAGGVDMKVWAKEIIHKYGADAVSQNISFIEKNTTMSYEDIEDALSEMENQTSVRTL